MLIGTFERPVGAAGDIELPSCFAAVLSTGAVAARGIEPCIRLYPIGEWEQYSADLMRRLPYLSRPARQLLRHQFSGAEPVQIVDGRMSLPSRLRVYARIADRVAILGLDRVIEVWDLEHWQRLDEDVIARAEAIADSLTDARTA